MKRKDARQGRAIFGISDRLAAAFVVAAAALLLNGAIRAAEENPVPSASASTVAEAKGEKNYLYHASKNVEGLELLVGTQLLQIKRDETTPDFIPLLFAVQNLRHRGVDVLRDRIHLYDHYGTELPMATLAELRQEYNRQRYDRQVLELTNFVGQLERTSRYVPTNFFPLPGEIGIYRIQVPQWGKMADMLYFKGKIAAGESYRLVIQLDDEKLPELSVDFSIS